MFADVKSDKNARFVERSTEGADGELVSRNGVEMTGDVVLKILSEVEIIVDEGSVN